MNNRVHISFFINSKHSYDKWSSVKTIFEECCRDKNFKVSILKEADDIDWTYNNFLNNLNENIKVYTYYKNGSKLDLLKLGIDVIITFNPYYQEYMDWDEWKDKIVICLKSYGVYCERCLEKNEESDFKKLKIFEQSKYVFCESQHQKECLEEYWGDKKKFILSGSVNFDYILKPKNQIKNNLWMLDKNKNPDVKRIIWSPHWSIKRHYSYGLNEGEDGTDLKDGFYQKKGGFSQFTKYADLWLKIPKLYPNLDIVMKPHPCLFIDLKRQTDGEWNDDKIEKWKKDFLNNPNTQIMENGMYDDLFLTSDAIINDSISFVAEYLPTLKPFLECTDTNDSKFNEFGKKIVNSYYKAYNEKDIIDFIENIVIDGNDNMYDERKKALKENLYIPKGGSGHFIKNFIKGEFIKEKNKKEREITILKNLFKKNYGL